MRCQASGCNAEAVSGEAWTEGGLQPLRSYHDGIEMMFSVRDIGVRLALCEDHADVLTTAGWDAARSVLRSWGWAPLQTRDLGEATGPDEHRAPGPDTMVTFADQASSSSAFVVVRKADHLIAIAFGIEADGDLDMLVAVEDARRVAQAILDAIDAEQ